MRTRMLLGSLAVIAALAFVATQPGPARASAMGVSPAASAPGGGVVLGAVQVDGVGVAEVSGLAWDAMHQHLYAVSDQGWLYRFAVRTRGDRLVAVTPDSAAALFDPHAAARGPQARKRFNAEGLALRTVDGTVELIVALEENPPQIARFSPVGQRLGALPVPTPADDIRVYQKKGRGLESVAWHPRWGLMTAPEAPLKSRPAGVHTIFANGHAWSFARHAPGSRLKGLDVLPDGNLLVLERSRRGGSKHDQIASLRRVDLAACTRGVCPAALVTRFATGSRNFEGMTLLDAHHVLVASDNGGDATEGTTFRLIVMP